ncbi:hypothetical protein SCAR479_11031 [Seiridium cardinale]|uniref:Rhodopsin domain-containing protein n=1 Tax=Seiridium cardinale TaxID=138064 RepID=A0ABR2XFC4_9PEZI
MADTATIISLLGFYDNFGEATPAWNHKGLIIGLTVPFLICSWVCVLFRLYIRLRIIYAPGWDDALVLLFLLTGTANGIGICVASKYGLGQHLLLLSYDDMVGFLKSFYVANASYVMSTALIKASLLFQYLRIFDRGRTRIVCIIVLIFTCLWGTAYMLLAWFPCRPIYGYWNWAKSESCWAWASLNSTEFFATFASHAVMNMLLDFIVLTIPMPLYFRATTSGPTRRRLLLLLTAGTLVSGISIWRLALCVQNKAATYPAFDPTWYGTGVIVLGMMEVNAASICACIPVFWPVLTKRIDQIFVTQEVKITRERRFSEERDDGIELNDGASSMHSRGGSMTSQSQMHLTKQSTHYMDDYVLDQVDPLRTKNNVQVSTELITKSVERKRSERSMF